MPTASRFVIMYLDSKIEKDIDNANKNELLAVVKYIDEIHAHYLQNKMCQVTRHTKKVLIMFQLLRGLFLFDKCCNMVVFVKWASVTTPNKELFDISRNKSLKSCPIKSRSDPSNKFDDKSRNWSFERFSNENEIEDNELKLKYKISRLDSRPKENGIVPFKIFSDKFNLRSIVSLPKDIGIEPFS
ncbi:hypothetical protein Tco_1082459 [Tanacetum coccineum]|uniref:Uncharacterized protein n=1 Tax=Tanacetum coccineum TaxID=301880 RepID=A0ABQ5I1R0_9ASTR